MMKPFTQCFGQPNNPSVLVANEYPTQPRASNKGTAPYTGPYSKLSSLSVNPNLYLTHTRYSITSFGEEGA